MCMRSACKKRAQEETTHMKETHSLGNGRSPEGCLDEVSLPEVCSHKVSSCEQALDKLQWKVGLTSTYFIPDLNPVLILNTEIELFSISSIQC